jgi:hypothetical protein
MTPRLLTIVLLMPVALAWPQTPSRSTRTQKIPSGTLAGKVTDSVLNDPLAGAGVFILDSGFAGPAALFISDGLKTIRSSITNENGTYSIAGLQSNFPVQYWAEYCHDDYIPILVPMAFPMNGDQKLTRRKADVSYWKKKADQDFVFSANETASDFDKQWIEFENSMVSASGKAWVARSVEDRLTHQPQVWQSNHVFLAYASANPETLESAEEAIRANKTDSSTAAVDPKIIQNMRVTRENYKRVFKSTTGSLTWSTEYDACNPLRLMDTR